ncbi:MAG: hypothetical protein ACLFUS_14550 [Candidatus Sumerlaeia bacterium]
MSQGTEFDSQDSVLESVVLGISDCELRLLVRQMVDLSGLQYEIVQSEKDLIHKLREDGHRLAIVELSMLKTPVKMLCDAMGRISSQVRIIVIADSPKAAQEAGVEVGGCVHHLFTSYPSPDYLRAFLFSARDKLNASL